MRGKTRFFCSSRRGQALVEFAIVATVLTMLVAGMVSFGIILCKANVVQQAADVGAQELARMPLSPVNTINPGNENGYLDDLLYADASDPSSPAYAVRQQIFDEQYLYVDAGNLDSFGGRLSLYMADKPLLNRLLMPAMVYDADANAYRFPGAIVRNQSTGKTTILVPLVTARDANTGMETIEWHRPVEEMKFPDGNGNFTVGQFSVAASSSSTGFSSGVCALRIYCPVQSPMVGFQSNSPPQPNVDNPIAANDAGVTVNDPYGLAQKYSLLVPAGENPGGTESGEYGMGSFYFSAAPLTYNNRNVGLVRPFRKVVVGQGVYRREVFGGD